MKEYKWYIILWGGLFILSLFSPARIIVVANLIPLFVLVALVRKHKSGRLVRLYSIAMLWSMIAATVLTAVGFSLAGLPGIWTYIGIMPFITIFWVIVGIIAAKMVD